MTPLGGKNFVCSRTASATQRPPVSRSSWSPRSWRRPRFGARWWTWYSSSSTGRVRTRCPSKASASRVASSVFPAPTGPDTTIVSRDMLRDSAPADANLPRSRMVWANVGRGVSKIDIHARLRCAARPEPSRLTTARSAFGLDRGDCTPHLRPALRETTVARAGGKIRVTTG